MDKATKSITKAPNLSDIRRYLEAVHSHAKGCINLRAIPPKELLPQRTVKKIFSDKIDEIENFVAENIEDNIYCGVASRANDDGSKAGCLEISCLWAHIDYKDYTNGEDDAFDSLKQFPLKPSICVFTGPRDSSVLVVPSPATA